MTPVGKVPEHRTLCKRCRQMKPASLFRWLDSHGEPSCSEDCRDRFDLIEKIRQVPQLPIPREPKE